MTVQIGQQAYTTFPVESQPGALVDNSVRMVTSFCAAEDIYPGRLLELASDGISVQQVQQTSSTLNIIGVSMLESAKEGFGAQNLSTSLAGVKYVAGDMVPVLMQGKIFAEWSGTTQGAFPSILNAYHSSTTATNRGKITDVSTSTGSGTEITALPHSIAVLPPVRANSGNIIALLVNVPGAA